MIIETTDADYAALLAGTAPRHFSLPEGPIESPEVLGVLRALASGIETVFAPASWLIVENEEVVGLCSLVKSPSDSTCEIGYGIAACRRRRGLASGAVAAVLEWARNDPRVALVRAETSIDNPASQRVLVRNGFEHVSDRADPEDGPLMCWQIAVR